MAIQLKNVNELYFLNYASTEEINFLIIFKWDLYRFTCNLQNRKVLLHNDSSEKLQIRDTLEKKSKYS